MKPFSYSLQSNVHGNTNPSTQIVRTAYRMYHVRKNVALAIRTTAVSTLNRIEKRRSHVLYKKVY